MIRVRVKTYAELQKYNPQKKGGEFIVQLEDGSSLKNLMEFLGVPEHQVMLVLKNGRKAAEGELLADEDAVTLYPVVGGG